MVLDMIGSQEKEDAEACQDKNTVNTGQSDGKADGIKIAKLGSTFGEDGESDSSDDESDDEEERLKIGLRANRIMRRYALLFGL